MVETDWDMIEKIGWGVLLLAMAELCTELASSVRSDRKIKERRALVEPYRDAAALAARPYPLDYGLPARPGPYLATPAPLAILPPPLP